MLRHTSAHDPFAACSACRPRDVPTPSNNKQRRVLVAGGAGALGAAVLEQILASHAFEQVAVLVTQPVNVTLRRLVTVSESSLWRTAPTHTPEDTAIIVFDRERSANGRELAFLRPQPEGLPALAAALHQRGARRLIVVMPHSAASLPDALKRGLANLDEHAVAALDFEHLLFIRSAQAPKAHARPRPCRAWLTGSSLNCNS